ncbi:hypothetical protein [Nostoc commune]|nr:hypothetical protein [Nostoc commune]
MLKFINGTKLSEINLERRPLANKPSLKVYDSSSRKIVVDVA